MLYNRRGEHVSFTEYYVMLNTPRNDVQPGSGRVRLKSIAEVRLFYLFLDVRAEMTASCRFGELLQEGCNVLEVIGVCLPIPGSRNIPQNFDGHHVLYKMQTLVCDKIWYAL